MVQYNKLRVQEQHYVGTCDSQTTWQIKLSDAGTSAGVQ